MRSTPRAKLAKYSVRTRRTSSAVGPAARKRAISSSSAFSTRAGSTPGRTVAWIMNCPPISRGLR
jgi:hypothetical protein